MENVVEIKNLTKYYGKTKAVDNISFEVKKGEIFGFIGPNGAGKSTTIRSILKLIKIDNGSIFVFGNDLKTKTDKYLKDIGYLPSEVFYYDGMKVKELLKYSASFYNKDCSKRIAELCQILELDQNKKIEELSYGNKKKVGIVQGLLHEPKLIILDEPTSGLDPLMQHKFFEILKEENKKGTTVLFSSHILSEVQKVCSRVAIIKEGKIIKTQKISELKEDNCKKCEIILENKIEAKLFDIVGVKNLTIEDKKVEFLYKGNIKELIVILNNLEVKDVKIEELSLEEVFMHYYE